MADPMLEGAAERRKGEGDMRLYANQPSGTLARARQLRRDASEPEKRLLRGLREAFPTLKWRHQVPFGDYYPDILCFSEKLVIEVDGDTHASNEQHDGRRTRFLEQEGYRVLRVWNNDVMENLEGVIANISLSLREREGAAQRRKGEGDQTKEKGELASASSPSPSPFRAFSAPSLSRREREQ